MQIRYVEISNFRKLQAIRLDLAAKTTLLVGANNSGKTSAMVAMRRFLIDRGAFSLHDFTLCHWSTLDAQGEAWEASITGAAAAPFDWGSICPSLDIWLTVASGELHHVQKLLPTVDWNGEDLGVRLRFEPVDAAKLQEQYTVERDAARVVLGSMAAGTTPIAANSGEALEAAPESPFELWPASLTDFLARKLNTAFAVKAYLLDPSARLDPESGVARPQPLPEGSEPLDSDPFKDLIRIDEIPAQRGLGIGEPKGGVGDDDGAAVDSGGNRKLSTLLRAYYAQHLDPFDRPEPADVQALQALHSAQLEYRQRLTASFAPALSELQRLGYPGMTDPRLTLSPVMKAVDGLNHRSAVQYEVPTATDDPATPRSHVLPEDSNGFGYQNLVYMVFRLMSFRDRWMRVGKAGSERDPAHATMPRLHLVLVEEPEAHLHAQVQQVFIQQAYAVLRNHVDLGDSAALCTQLVVSTHSSHIAHEAEFSSLRYFRRLPKAATAGSVPVSTVINLSTSFGDEDMSERFAKRYLKATHCDLFFADGAVLVEGPAERVLVPHLVRKRTAYGYLNHCYLTWLEIGGSHAHRLRSLIERLGLTTLVITDLDAMNATTTASEVPARGQSLRSRNETLKTWIPANGTLDDLLDTKDDDLTRQGPSSSWVRVAYQQPVNVVFKAAAPAEALANTFEDALVYANIDLFKTMAGDGLISSFRDTLTQAQDIADLAQRLRTDLKGGDKARFALDLLYSDQSESIEAPDYIHRGLLWLAERLRHRDAEVTGLATGATA